MNYRIKPLPHWVLTDLQPAFYDTESVTTIEMLAKIYPKIEELISDYNYYVDQINKTIKEFEDGIISDFNCFKNCIIDTMNDYITSIDMKITLQDNKIEESINNQNEIIDNAVNYMKNNLVSTLSLLFDDALREGKINAQLVEDYDNVNETLSFSIEAIESEE